MMKNKTKIILLAFLLMGSFKISFGQHTCLDSVNIEMHDLKVRMTLYNTNNISEQVSKDLKSLQQVLGERNNISSREYLAIRYMPDQSLTIGEAGNTDILILDNGKQHYYQFKSQCNLNGKSYLMQILFNDIQALQSDSLVTKVKEVLDSVYFKKPRFTKTYNYSYSGNAIVHNKVLDRSNGYMDMLALQGGVGVNVIKNRLITDISFGAAFIFSQGGYARNEFFISNGFYFDFNEKGHPVVNQMINLGYRYNLARHSETSNWLGVELGYITQRNGGLFDKNTFKVGVNWELGKYIRVTPQLFFTSDFSKAYPGIRIGFGI